MAEQGYRESLYAWVCRAPENDVLHENWNATHRHFSSEMFENLGNVRFGRGKLAEAARAYDLSLWQDPRNVRALKNLAAVLSKLGRQTELLKTWNQLRQVAPQDPDVQRVFHANLPSHT
jgi:tetratricopeptide (TPR) repeat protein